VLHFMQSISKQLAISYMAGSVNTRGSGDTRMVDCDATMKFVTTMSTKEITIGSRR